MLWGSMLNNIRIPFYVYMITINSTGQFYIGSRTANARHHRLPADDLWICYYTSSRTIKRLISELGKDAFTVSVIHTNFDADDTYWFEQDTIKEHINNPLCLNKKYQDRASGNTIFSTAGKPSWNKGLPSKAKGVARSADTVAKISANRKGKGIGRTPVNRGIPMSEERYAQHMNAIADRPKLKGTDNPFYGKTHSDEVKALIAANTSRAQKGRAKPKHPCPHCGLLCSANTMPHHIRSKHDASLSS